MTETKS